MARNVNNHSKAAEAAAPERKDKAHSAAQRSEDNPDKALAGKIRANIAARELRKRLTLGIYSLKCDESHFGVPFCAVSDHFALLAQKELLPLSNCYKLGDVCLLDGKIIPCKPFVVLDNKVVIHD